LVFVVAVLFYLKFGWVWLMLLSFRVPIFFMECERQQDKKDLESGEEIERKRRRKLAGKKRNKRTTKMDEKG